ncbi:MAG: hypothetical protein P8O07_07640 [Crocinitomicaceae bacterium]|nr:hypothetical protein [Crocinitomicaceae bacterium]
MAKLRIDKEKLDKLSPEDAIPLFIRIRRFILGKKKPDGFTRLIYTINFISWFLLMAWNLISFGVVQMSQLIYDNKGLSVKAILRRKGRELGFNGEHFLQAITDFYFLSIFVWIVILIGLVLLYRKSRFYTSFYFGGFMVHFTSMFLMIGFQYFLEDISLFDKILYGVMLITGLIHYTLMMKEKTQSFESPT